MKDTLSKYGQGFQTKVIAALLNDLRFLGNVSTIAHSRYFDSEANKWLLDMIIDYYLDYKKIPTMDVFKVHISKVKNDTLKKSLVDQLRNVYTQIGTTDFEYIQDEFTEFCKNQNLKKAIEKSVEYLQIGEYDNIKSIIDKAMKVDGEGDIGHYYIQGFDERTEEVDRNTVPTGWTSINELMDGGLGPGELGVVVAPSGVGKCVGGDTTIDIEYEEIGFELSDEFIAWYNPWDKIHLNDGLTLYVYEVEKILIKKTHKRKVRETIRVDEFFDNNDIPEKEDHFVDIPYIFKVNTPYGYHKVPQVCRTVKQESIRLYFTNNKTLECGWEHKLKVNGDWKEVKDVDIENDLIETETGITQIKEIKERGEKILYDLSVDKVHCFYSNGILSHNTWALCHIGANAVKQGLNVVHYSLELSEYYVGGRYDTVFTNIPSSKIKEEGDKVKKVIQGLDGDLMIKYFPPKGISVKDIELHLDKLRATGYIPDLVIIDYADLLLSSNLKIDSTYQEQGSVYIDLRGLGGELGFPIWTASQANRCLSLDTLIQTPSGSMEIGKIKEGDEILTHMGYKPITKVYPIEKQAAYKVKLKSGKEIVVSAKHLFPTKYGRFTSIETGMKVGDKLFTKKS